MDFLGCHVNNTPLTISSKKISKGDINFSRNLWSNLISPDGIISFTIIPACHLWTVEILSLVVSRSVMSILPLNRQVTKSHLSVQ